VDSVVAEEPKDDMHLCKGRTFEASRVSRQNAGTSANRSSLGAKLAGLRENDPLSLPAGLPLAGRNHLQIAFCRGEDVQLSVADR
jgi:hypothetical protein